MAYSKAFLLLGLLSLSLLLSSEVSARELAESTTATIEETKAPKEEKELDGRSGYNYGYGRRGYGGYGHGGYGGYGGYRHGGYGRRYPPEEEEEDVNPEGYGYGGYGGYGHGGYGGYGGYGHRGYGHRHYGHGGYGRHYPPQEEDGTN